MHQFSSCVSVSKVPLSGRRKAVKDSVAHILILTESPFSKRDYDRFGVELLSQSFRVSILDCTAWLKPDFRDNYSTTAYHCPGYVSIADRDSLVSRLDGLVRTVAIDYLSDCARSRRIRAELKSRNILRVVVLQGLLPAPFIKWSDRVRQSIYLYAPRSVPGRIYRRIAQALRSQDPAPEVAVLSGSACLKDKILDGVTHKIWAHSFDFDIYLECKDQIVPPVAPYAVFLDEDMIYHSDYACLETRPPTTEQAYFASINGFFREFERSTGLSVIIAAHPRSNYELRPQLWGSRTAIYGKTAQLVRDASVVLCHQSTAISFAVLWRKPTIFLTMNKLIPSYFGPRIAFMSTLLGAPLLNVDRDRNQLPNVMPDIKSLPSVDEVAYAKYIDEYIKRPGTPYVPVWQIFSEYVQREIIWTE